MAPRIIRPPPHWRPVDPLPEASVFSFVFSNPNIPPNHTALIDGSTGETVTHADLKLRSQTLATGLVKLYGIQPGQVVTIFTPNSIHYHPLVFAVQCCGAIASVANAAYHPSELAHQLKDSGSVLIFAHPSVVAVAEDAAERAGWSCKMIQDRLIWAVRRSEVGRSARRYRALDEVWRDQPPMEPARIRNPKKTIAYIGYSSGTTGVAKGVMTSHYNMTSMLSHLYVFPQNHIHVGVLPFSHIYGLGVLVHWTVLTGQTTVVMPRFELDHFCTLVDKHLVSAAFIVPPIAVLLAKDPRAAAGGRYKLDSLRFVCSGAAPMGLELERALAQRLKNGRISQAYGLTETSPVTHVRPIDGPVPGSIGHLLPNQLGRVVDPVTGKDCEPGKEGEVWLKGPNVMMGYVNRPDATADTITPDGWLKTGDIGYEKDGYWFITDRIKELIKYKGFQVPPAELESLLLAHAAVADCAVVGVYDDARATEVPRAYVVPSEGAGAGDRAATAREIVHWVQERVAPHKRLRGGVIFIDQIPKSPSGKILRRVLRDQAKAEQAAGSAGVKL